MTYPSKFDPEVRRRVLRELKRRHCEQAAMTPTQRLERLEELRKLAEQCREGRPIRRSRTDESPELLLRLLQRWRDLPRPGQR